MGGPATADNVFAADRFSIVETLTSRDNEAKSDFERLLQLGSISELEEECKEASKLSLESRLIPLRSRLKEFASAPQSFDSVMANAKALLACKAPVSAQMVLSRFSPSIGVQRRAWLLLSWEAANASMDYAKAALMLRRLSQGKLLDLESQSISIFSEDGRTLERSALDLLAEHEIALGNINLAIQVLMAGRNQGVNGSRRLNLAANLITRLDAKEANKLLTFALEGMIEDQAWTLAEKTLRLKLNLIPLEANDSVLKDLLELLEKTNTLNLPSVWEKIQRQISFAD